MTADICNNHENRGKITASIHTPKRHVFFYQYMRLYFNGLTSCIENHHSMNC